MLRVVDELLWTLRRHGVAVSTAQALDVARAIAAVGWEDRSTLREAIACVVVTTARDRPRFEAAFDGFFDPDAGHARDLWSRLRAEGFGEAELAALRELLEATAQGGDANALAWTGGRSAIDRLLAAAEVRRALEPMTSPIQAGFFAQRVLQRTGIGRGGDAVRALRERLRDALGTERADALVDALVREAERARRWVREHVDRVLAQRLEAPERAGRRRLEQAPFVSLGDAELDEVRRAVRSFAARLRGAARVRQKRARRGRIDPHRTARRSVATGGVPFRPARRRRRRDRPKLLVLCDVSDSVRTASRFMLEFVWAVHELFERTRSFVFVSELGEVTGLFEREPVHRALAEAWGGGVVDVNANSSYGRVLRQAESTLLAEIDRRTTVVVLGDGRTNYRDDGAEVLDRIRERARALVWLCPEPRATWGTGDSAMPVYAARASEVLEVRSAEDLEQAARRLLARRP